MPFECYGLNNAVAKVKSSEVLTLFFENVANLASIERTIKVIIVVNANLSSHFFNVLRCFCDTNKLILLIGNEKIIRFLDRDELLISQNSIIAKGKSSCLLIKKVEDFSKFNDIIELNCSSHEICHRPNKLFDKKTGEMIVRAQSFDCFTVEFKQGKLWYDYGKSFSNFVINYLDDPFKYSDILTTYLDVLQEIFMSNNLDNSEKERLKYELYRYSPFVGYFLNVISYYIYNYSEKTFDTISLESAKQYNLNMDDSVAITTIVLLKKLLKFPWDIKIYTNIIPPNDLSVRYVTYLYIVSIMSDLRRRANSIITGKR